MNTPIMNNTSTILNTPNLNKSTSTTRTENSFKSNYIGMRKIDLIVVHCSATRSNVNFTPEALDSCHRQRGFKGCGYHFYITKDGLVHAMRPVHLAGAHARGYNAHSLGVCYEGGLDPQGKPCDTRTVKQKEMLRSLIGRLKVEFGIKKVVGHRDLSPDLNMDGVITPDEWLKQCPCFDVSAEMY